VIITSAQLKAIQSGDFSYVSCDFCGYGELSKVDSPSFCPDCGDVLCPSGEGWDFGYGWCEERRTFGLSYEFKAGDFDSGD
jgi:hypothetical protein